MQTVSELLEAQRRKVSGDKNKDVWGTIIYNVNVYGATGDGTTDDSDKIQDAIDDCSENGGGIVVLPPGTFAVSKPLIKKAKVSIKGSGMKSTFLKFTGVSGGAIIDTSNQDLRWTSIEDLGFIKGSGVTGNVTGILGGSTLTNYNSAICVFKNLYFSFIKYGISGNAEPAGVGIFDSIFENIWCDNNFYGLWIHGSGNVIIHPRLTLNDTGLVLDYLNGESFASVQMLGGVCIQNNYDIGVIGANGIRPSTITGTWFEQSVYGIVNVPYANTRVMSLSFKGCMLSSSSTVDMLNLFNAVGAMTVDTCTIVQTGSTNAKNILPPSSVNGHLKLNNIIGYNYDGSSFYLDDNDTDTKSAFRAYNDTAQTINAATWTKLTFTTENFDNKSEFDSTTNYEFTATKSGLYQISAGVRWAAQVDGNRTLLAIYRNGAADTVIYDGTVGGTNVSSAAGSALLKLAAGDKITIFVHTINATNTGSIGSNYTYFEAVKVN